MNLITTNHFEDRVDEYLEHYTELDGISYEDIAAQVMRSTSEVELTSGVKYRECTLQGVTYGIGVKQSGDTVTAATVISPIDVEANQARTFRCTRRTVTAFN